MTRPTDLPQQHDSAGPRLLGPAEVRALADALEEVQQDRHRDGVGQVGDQRGRRRAGQLGDPHRVAVHQREAVGLAGGEAPDRVGQGSGEDVVDLDGHHVAGDLEQGEGERAEPRAHLENHVILGHP
jgi:hypothetical protein